LLEHDDCCFVSLDEIAEFELSPYDFGAVRLMSSDRFQAVRI